MSHKKKMSSFNQSIDLRIQDLKSEQYLLDDKLEDTKLASTTICMVIYKF